MIFLRDLTLRRGPHILFQNVNWTIYPKQRIGVIGANGTGKTSLFSLLLGNLVPDLGNLSWAKQLKLAHVAQETEALPISAIDFVLEGDDELRSLEQQLILAEQQDKGALIGTLHEKLNQIDAYSAPARAAQLLAGLGFDTLQQKQPVASFSGGWRVRLNLARALMCRSDVLLLDEPTNHLDLDAVLWLEQWLQKYSGTFLLISHDRDFLDNTVDQIVYLENQQIRLYEGNYSIFEKSYVQALQLQQAAYEKQQKQLTHMQSFVDRFRYKASKARQAQSRLKAIERLVLVEAVQQSSAFQFKFEEIEHAPNPLLTLDKASVGYNNHIILQHLNLQITPQARIAILGPNGAGKSTFIKLLAGVLLPCTGIRTLSAGTKIGYFAQHQIDHLDLSGTPLNHLQQLETQVGELELRKFLGSFGFIGDRVHDKVKHFSGGEKSRLALALLVWQKPNLLLLDEPTNHLDLEMRHALSLALQNYAGAVILVSHDRFLIKTTADQLWLVAEGKMDIFNGDLTDYGKWLVEFRKKQTEKNLQPIHEIDLSKKVQRQQAAQQREKLRPLQLKIKQLESQLIQVEKALADITILLTDLTLYQSENKNKLQDNLLQQAKLKRLQTQLEEAWLHACEERDQL